MAKMGANLKILQDMKKSKAPIGFGKIQGPKH